MQPAVELRFVIERTQGEAGDAGHQVLRNDRDLIADGTAEVGCVCGKPPRHSSAGVLVDIKPGHLLHFSPVKAPHDPL